MIRFAIEKDCKCLAALSTQVWLETYAKEGLTVEHGDYVFSNFTPSAFNELLDSPQHRVFVAEQDNALVGLSVVNLHSSYELQDLGFEIERLYIHSEFRGRGYGREILRAISSEVGNRFWLYTWVNNASNTFYQRLGFKYMGMRSFYFGTQEINNNVYAHDGFST